MGLPVALLLPFFVGPGGGRREPLGSVRGEMLGAVDVLPGSEHIIDVCPDAPGSGRALERDREGSLAFHVEALLLLAVELPPGGLDITNPAPVRLLDPF